MECPGRRHTVPGDSVVWIRLLAPPWNLCPIRGSARIVSCPSTVVLPYLLLPREFQPNLSMKVQRSRAAALTPPRRPHLKSIPAKLVRLSSLPTRCSLGKSRFESHVLRQRLTGAWVSTLLFDHRPHERQDVSAEFLAFPRR